MHCTKMQEKSIGCGTIDMVVGRMASAKGGDGVKPGTYVDNSFFADAARIYISETTDVDQNFGLSEGIVGNPKGQSCVAMKADQCRVVGRAGIKIMTGAGNNIFFPLSSRKSRKASVLGIMCFCSSIASFFMPQTHIMLSTQTRPDLLI